MKQERMSNKWRYELEQTVKAYEAMLTKIRKENKILRNAVGEARKE